MLPTIDPQIGYGVSYAIDSDPDWAAKYIEKLTTHDPFLAKLVAHWSIGHSPEITGLIMYGMLLMYKLLEVQQEINEMES